MATESSDPRVGRIAAVALVAIVVLVVTRGALVSYFDAMDRAETYRKVGSLKPEALMSVRADEKMRLSSGPMPIDQAVQRLATRGRMGASPDVVPSASKDMAPMQGWVQMPATVPPAMTAPPPPPAPSTSSSAAPASSASGAPAPGAPPRPIPKQP
jgi:hypothetical protein